MQASSLRANERQPRPYLWRTILEIPEKNSRILVSAGSGSPAAPSSRAAGASLEFHPFEAPRRRSDRHERAEERGRHADADAGPDEPRQRFLVPEFAARVVNVERQCDEADHEQDIQ